MRFVLTYEGQLPSEQHCSAATKHGIRKQFHPQLKELWEIEPTLKAWETGGLGIIDGFEVPGPPKVRLGGFEFRPLVTGELNLVCGLGIVFLRPENPGRIVKPGGDIDNRIKTLLDCLTIPSVQQIKGQSPASGEHPFFCLLHDDALVTGFEVRTERLLKAPADPGNVHVHVTVTVRPVEVTHTNVRFLGGFLS